MSKLDKLPASSDSTMKVVIIYDDFAFAAKANATLQRPERRTDVRVQWAIKAWHVNSLKDAATAEEALVEAVDAHLIVFAGRRPQSLPFWLHEWLERWVLIRQVQDAALAVIGKCDGRGLTRPVTPELSRFVRQHGLSFIIDEGPVAKDAADLFVRHSGERGLPLPAVRSHFTDPATHDSYRSWGIND